VTAWSCGGLPSLDPAIGTERFTKRQRGDAAADGGFTTLRRPAEISKAWLAGDSASLIAPGCPTLYIMADVLVRNGLRTDFDALVSDIELL